MGEDLTAQYLAVIDGIVEQTLKGNVRSKAQVRSQLAEAVSLGTGELFERALASRIAETEPNVDSSLKAPRILRALKTIESEWQAGQADRQAAEELASAAEDLTEADTADRVDIFLDLIDPNQPYALNRKQLQQLSKQLTKEEAADWRSGIQSGLANYERLEPHLVSWLYESSGQPIGFGERSRSGPWPLWKTHATGLPQLLFTTVANEEPIDAITRTAVDITRWIDLAITLHFLRRSLITWFDKQPYSAKAGKQLSYSTSLIFSAIWGRLSQGFARGGNPTYRAMGDGCFLLMLQGLRQFTQRDDFPLYGGVFASFSGDYLQDTLDYFDEPLTQVDGTQEKARIITLLGYSRQMLGRSDEADKFHQQALEIAQEAGDFVCETANLCHLARNAALAQTYDKAISHAQRALILARQRGDRVGEANALVNMGYAQVLQARANDVGDKAVYDSAIAYLQQGLELATKQGDRQSQALAYNSLGIAYVMCDRAKEGLDILVKGSDALKGSGNVYLQGLYTLYSAEAHHRLENSEQAVFYSALSMHLLHRIKSKDWRQAAGLFSVLEGKLGEQGFRAALEKYQRQLTPIMGMEGFGELMELLAEYRNG